ncbi:endoplasmic oxidoreductin [Linnemannia elongata AG-77]|uniref:Endoplasmic oxidoreductin n=1 Tax=Linnemannia elongata AG-77 TaxID=1314771 RepID=A0A197JIA5_9FUNG|nr:endoplasmic oxidoreductin [Linnemannia elongata AG-77]
MSRMSNILFSVLAALIAILAAGLLYGNDDTDHLATNPNPSAVWDTIKNTNNNNNQIWDKSPECNNPSGLIGDSSCCDYETVGKLNIDFSAKLQEIVSMPFFRYFKVNLYKECPFWDNAGLCMNRDCSVETMDKQKIPEQWRSEALGKVSMPTTNQVPMPNRPVKIKDQEFCAPDIATDEVYVDLKDNPERFTGYSGPSADMVWKAIYEENCFDVSEEMTAGCQYCESERSKVPKGKGQLQQLMEGIARNDGPEESCLEKRVYYRLISGLHASISIHICDEWFNQTTGEWGPNLDCFVSRVGMHPERLENIYFDYVVLLRAVTKISDYLAGYEFCTGDQTVDKNIMSVVTELVDLVKQCPPTFDEKLLFQDGGQGKKLKNQFRDHFRNVTRIMDCVGCEKCRLWGKVQTTGLGTALKILLSYDDASLKGHRADGVLSRSEIVSLLNTFNRLSESISAIERFGVMYQQRLREEEETSGNGNVDATATQTTKPSSPIKAPTKEEDDRDAIVYKALLAKVDRRLTSAYRKLDAALESKNITLHRAAVKNVAAWIHRT